MGHDMQSCSPPASGTQAALHLLQAGSRSGVGRRDRRTRTGGDISLPWSCGRDAGNAERRVQRRTTDSSGPSDTGVCALPGSTRIALALKHSGVQAACRLFTDAAGRLCHLGSPQLVLGGSGGRLRDRVVEPSPSTATQGHSTMWWLDHCRPPSRLLSGTRNMLMDTRTSVQESAGCTHPMTMAYASPISRRSKLQRRAALCNHKREGFLFYLRDPDWAPRLCFACRPTSSWHVPEPVAPTSIYRQPVPIAFALEGRPFGSGSAVRRSSLLPPPDVQSALTVTSGRQPPRRHRSSQKGSSCSAPPFAGYSCSVCSSAFQPPPPSTRTGSQAQAIFARRWKSREMTLEALSAPSSFFTIQDGSVLGLLLASSGVVALIGLYSLSSLGAWYDVV